MTSTERLTPDDLLQHVEWAKSLARRLVRDESTADDVAQEALSVALEKPPGADRPIRPWIARVMQNVARQRSRSEGRRAHRERSAARAESAPSAAELTQRAEAHGLLVDALLGLDERTRQTVLLRYFEGLSAAEIARVTGEPSSTVRSRLSRGLGQLRERLDDRFAGDRSAWHAALAPLVRFPAASAAVASLGAAISISLAMKFVLSAAVILVALMVAAAVTGLGVFPSPPLHLETVTFEALAPPSSPLASIGNGPGREAVDAPHLVPPPEPKAAPEHDRVAIDVRFVNAEGAPIPGVDATFWGGIRRKSDANGRLRIEVDKGAKRSGPVAVRRAGFVNNSFEISFPADGTRDAGDFVLRAGGMIEGHVVGDRVAVSGLRVSVSGAESPSAAVGGLRMVTVTGLGASMTTTDEEGRFRLDGLLPGEAVVKVESEDQVVTGSSGRVEVRAGQKSTGLEIVASSVPPDRLIRGTVVTPDGELVPNVVVQYEWGGWIANGKGIAMTGKDGRFVIVLDRARTVELSTFGSRIGQLDNGQLEGVAGGTTDAVVRLTWARTMQVAVAIPGAASVQGRIVARTDDGEIFELFAGPLDGGGHDIVVPRTRFRVEVEADRYHLGASRWIDPESLPDRVEVALERMPVFEGRVVNGDSPAAGARITVCRAARNRVRVSGIKSLAETEVVAEAVADPKGAFDLTLRDEGTYFVRAELGGRAAAELGPLRLDPEVPSGELLFHLTEGGSIRGRVEDADGIQQTRVLLASRGDGLARTVRTAPDGTFSFDGLTPGPWRVEITRREFEEGMSGSSSTFGSAYDSIDGNCVVQEGRITWFDLTAGAARLGAMVVGRFEPDGLSPNRFRIQLLSEDTAGDTALGPTARVAADGSFVAESANTGSHSLLIEEILDSSKATRLRFLVPLELAAGERELALRIPSAFVVTGDAADPERHRLLWRGPGGIVALSGLAPHGEGRWFPAGDVSLVPLESVSAGIPAVAVALDQIDVAAGAAESIGR